MKSLWKHPFNFLIKLKHLQNKEAIRSLNCIINSDLIGSRARAYVGLKNYSFNIHDYMKNHRLSEIVSTKHRGRQIHPGDDRGKKKTKKKTKKKK